MKAKHTKEYAEKFSKEYSLIIHDQIAFENGYLKAIEETNHVEVLEICKNIISLKEKALDTQGLFPVLQEIESLKEAISKAEEELKEDSHDPNCYHNCELCGSKCNCSDQPCSCCKE